jgi:hypothetical protein
MNLTLEKRTLVRMFHIYCKALHKPSGGLCSECDALLEYSLKRLMHCQFGEDKPTCKLCPVHCYSPQKRDEVREIMRFSGPRMIYHSPVLSIRHLIMNKIAQKHPKK